MDSLGSSSEMSMSTESSDVPCSHTNGSTTMQTDPSLNTNLFLDEMDFYWDDVSSRLTVSRIVTDSVLKGIVHAVQQEAVEQIASRDAEIIVLNQKLQEVGSAKVQGSDLVRSMENAMSEQEQEVELQNEITSILLKNFVKDLQSKFQTGSQDSKSLSLALSESRDRTLDELRSLRQQLDTISKSVLSSEWVFLVPQYNFEGLEDGSKHRVKEQSSRTVPGENGAVSAKKSEAFREEAFGDPYKLKHMNNEELISFFNKKISEMKLQHDVAEQKKTEEIFSLKRDLLNAKGSSPSHLRNNKEFEQMRKKISELISKLDDILSENKKSIARIKVDAFTGQQENGSTVHSESQQSQGLAVDKEKELGCISSGADKTSHFASIKADFEKQIKNLESEIEDARIEAITREDVHKIVLNELVSQLQMHVHGFETESEIKQDICSIIEKQAIAEAVSSIASLLQRSEENSSAKAASLQMQEKEKLKLVMDSFNEIVKEKEEFVSGIEFKAMKAHINSLCRDLDLLRDKVMNQDVYISEKNREFDINMGRLEQALHQVHCNEMSLSESNSRLRDASASLNEMEKQNSILHRIVEEKEKALTLNFAKEAEFKKCMKSMAISVTDFEKLVLDYQSKIANKIEWHESRLGLLKYDCNHVVKQGSFLRKKALRYKEISETLGANLQKAENEVDLLGDEVEALMNLLWKIYIALDHYSPILQHYTGIMEILHMIKRAVGVAK